MDNHIELNPKLDTTGPGVLVAPEYAAAFDGTIPNIKAKLSAKFFKAAQEHLERELGREVPLSQLGGILHPVQACDTPTEVRS